MSPYKLRGEVEKDTTRPSLPVTTCIWVQRSKALRMILDPNLLRKILLAAVPRFCLGKSD